MGVEVSTTFLGMLLTVTGIFSSFSKVSFSVMISQNIAERNRKNMKTKNCLFRLLNKKLLIVLKMPSSTWYGG